jgi:hypothetical protein
VVLKPSPLTSLLLLEVAVVLLNEEEEAVRVDIENFPHKN